MDSTLKALLSRNIPRVLANNLVLAKMTLGNLAAMDHSELRTLGLEDVHIKAIRDNRPNIPDETLRQVMEDSWDTCCVCTKRERDILIHHIIEWGQGGTHAESNLVVLCLEDHHRAHLRGGHANAALSEADIRRAKKMWIPRATKIRNNYQRSLLDPWRSDRWLWIHLDRLRALTQLQPLLRTDPIDANTQFLLNNGFIEESGHIAAETQWTEALAKPCKLYAFDSSSGQKMAGYVSGVLARLLRSPPVMDITDMLDNPEQLKRYIDAGQRVFFRSHLEVQRDPNGFPKNGRWIRSMVSKTDVRLEFAFDLWTSLSMTAMGTHLCIEAERSVVAEVVSVSTVGPQTRVHLTPLGISSNFLPHDPSQGAWVEGANNEDYRKRRKRAKVD